MLQNFNYRKYDFIQSFQLLFLIFSAFFIGSFGAPTDLWNYNFKFFHNYAVFFSFVLIFIAGLLTFSVDHYSNKLGKKSGKFLKIINIFLLLNVIAYCFHINLILINYLNFLTFAFCFNLIFLIFKLLIPKLATEKYSSYFLMFIIIGSLLIYYQFDKFHYMPIHLEIYQYFIYGFFSQFLIYSIHAKCFAEASEEDIQKKGAFYLLYDYLTYIPKSIARFFS
jgi:hypothetical protein